MKNQGNKLMTFRTFSVGIAAGLLALACGSEETPAGPVTVDRENCEDNPYLVGCDAPPEVAPPELEGPGPGPDQPGPDEPPPVPENQDYLDAKAFAENVLKAECGGCHGTQLTPATARAQMNYIDDIDQLIENDKLIPGKSADSIVIRRMRLGEMPPTNEGYDPVADAQINVIADFIDNPDYFEFEPNVICDDVVTFDELYSEVSEDLGREEAEDALFIRYISLANRVTSGICADGTALDRDRQALAKMVNALSIDTKVTAPEAVDPAKTLYKIDLRDYGWDRAINVDGQAFDDVWEAIIDANEYAVPFVGDQADDARADSGTDVPVMFLDSMLDVATVGNLYYATINLDVAVTLDDFIADPVNGLGIDVVANLDEETLIRAGTTKSRISRQDRLVEGHEIEVRAGVYYQSFDFANDQNESIFQDPFGFNEGGREAIFTLPNGMLAYVIADENGLLVEDSDILLDTNQGNFRALTSVSCSGCHARGFIEVVDEVREITEANARVLIADGTLDRDQLQQLQEVYLDPADFKSRVEEDSEPYLSALADADLPISADPVSATFLRFDRDMLIKDAAGDLGATIDELSDELDNLDPSLTVLDRGTLDRDDFTAVYVDSLCVMSVVLENQPDADLCALAAAALDL